LGGEDGDALTGGVDAAPAPGHTAWTARSCRSRCMVAASTSY